MIDLNVIPSETREQEGTLNPGSAQQAPADCHHGGSILPLHTIDVDSIEDDVVESSASAFAEAKSKSRSSRRRPVTVDIGRVPPNQPVIDCDRVCIDAELTMSSGGPVSKAASPRKEPTFTCPICMGSFTQETSTRCGHIFCKRCIMTTISRQSKCPTCRKKVTAKELIRVFLPARFIMVGSLFARFKKLQKKRDLS